LKHHVDYNETDGQISEPLYKGHLSITANIDQSLGWLLYTGFTVLVIGNNGVENYCLIVYLQSLLPFDLHLFLDLYYYIFSSSTD